MIGVWRNNNDINLTWEGDNTVLIQQTARFIMNNLKRKMKGKEVKFNTLSFFKKFDEVSSAKLTINDAKDLHKDENLIAMMEYRINLLIQKCVARLTEKVGEKLGVFDAWNETQTFYLQNLAKSYGELYVLNCFKSKIDQLKDSPTKKVLHDMFVMFGLVSLEKDLVLLRENDFILSESCDLIKNEIIKLCAVIKPELITIIDAIAPPDEILQAPLGSSKGFIFDSYLNEVYSAKGTFERPDWWEIVHHKSLNK